MANVTTDCPYHFSDSQSVLDVTRALRYNGSLTVFDLVVNCSSLCDAALGNGNPDLAGVGVGSSSIYFNFHNLCNTRINLEMLIFLIGVC